MTQLALIIDHEACWGCMACEVACKLENGVAPGLKFIRVGEEKVREREGKPFFSYTVDACRHAAAASRKAVLAALWSCASTPTRKDAQPWVNNRSRWAREARSVGSAARATGRHATTRAVNPRARARDPGRRIMVQAP